ncbi:hypothetical protein BJV77DRAFT_965345 [Russula vinacea]|nr:hypothetical protein BJV77DRAFT_965345 [Russula vinacea]
MGHDAEKAGENGIVVVAYTSGRTQNESGRDGKGESSRDGERESGQDSERESRRDDERAARERVGGTMRGWQEGEREGCQGRVASQNKGTMTMTRPQMRREECVKGENGIEGPIVGLGLYDRATAAESKCSGWLLEVACDANGWRTVGRGGMRRNYGDMT